MVSIKDMTGESLHMYLCFIGASVIDLCIANDILRSKPYEFKVLDINNSKHFPITLVKPSQCVNSATIPSVRKIVWDASKYDNFKHLMETTYNVEPSNVSLHSIIDNIYKAASQCELVKEVKLNGGKVVRGPIWYNSDCALDKKRVARKLRVFRKVKKHSNQIRFSACLGEYMDAKRALKETETNTRKMFYENISNKLRNSKDSKEFFQALSILKNSCGSSSKITVPVDTLK